jgi:hypothetical protein
MRDSEEFSAFPLVGFATSYPNPYRVVKKKEGASQRSASQRERHEKTQILASVFFGHSMVEV